MNTLNISEKEYRKLERDSYSSLSLFCSDKKGYYRKYILKENNDKLTPQLIFGSLVDCMLFTPKEVEERFVVSTANEPSPQMKTFCHNLKDVMVTARIIGSTGDLDATMKAAYNLTKYDNAGEEIAFKRQSFEKTAEKFEAECKPYFRQIMDLEEGKILIELEDYNKAELAIRNLRYSSNAGPIICAETGNGIEVFPQLVVCYELDGLLMKSMIDLVIVDHNTKSIRFFDLKTTHNVEKFDANYTKFGYYIQLGLYTYAIKQWVVDNNLRDYTLENMQFIVCDSYNYMAPLVYDTDNNLLLDAWEGFMGMDGCYYRGISQLIFELKWHKENNVWNISKEAYDNRGVVKLKIR